VSEAHFVEIFYAVTDLTENAVNLWTTHLSAHDDTKKVERGELHDLEMVRESAGRWLAGQTNLVVVAMVKHDVNSVDNISMFEGRAHAEFGCNLFLVLLLTFTRAFRAELFHGENGAVVLSLDETHCAPCAAAKDAPPFAILFAEMGLCGVVKRNNGGVFAGMGAVDGALSARGPWGGGSSVLALFDGFGRHYDWRKGGGACWALSGVIWIGMRWGAF
jgi:hypothetical protein